METDVPTEGSSDHNNADSKIKSIGVNLRVTGQCCQGGRKYMEDFFSVAYQQTDNMRDLEYAFIGIYDGHGGSEAATFAKEHLMMEIINQKLFWSNSDQDVLRAIREGYIATHYAMWREQENWPKTTNGLLSTAGTTATVAFIRNEKIYIGHVGDSGVVLGYQNEGENFWRAKQLTTDHKPESPAERRRIMQAGGKVGVKSGVPRVVWTRPRNSGHRGPVRANTPVEEIPFLAVARSLGDLWSYNAEFNEFVVSPDPDVQVIQINPKTFRCLIFGTDGLWNVVTPQEAVDTVCSREKMNESIAQNKQTNDGKNVPWINPSKGLVELALHTWSDKKMRADNTSVVTVILYPPACNMIKSAETGEAEPKKKKIKSVNDVDFATLLDDRTSFQEISEKYLRPERFRNINNPNYDNEHMYWSSSDPEGMRTNNWFWRCDTDTEPEETTAKKSSLGPVEQSLQSFDELAKPRTLFPNTTRVVDINNAEKLNAAVDHNDLYVNSFAETYNSLLDAQISRSSKEQQVPVSNQSTATSTPLSSSSGLQMQQILQEQQMYQQQCMSGEDGYMLTTLETRREQQRCGGMQTFKVFDQPESNDLNADSIQVNIRENSISYMANTVETKELKSCDNLPSEVAKQQEKIVEEAKDPVVQKKVVTPATPQETQADKKEKAAQESVIVQKKAHKQPQKEVNVPKKSTPSPFKPMTEIFIKQEIFDEDYEKGEASRIYALNASLEPTEKEVEEEQEKWRKQRLQAQQQEQERRQAQQRQQKQQSQKIYQEEYESLEVLEATLVEDEDGILEGTRPAPTKTGETVYHDCYVKIVDVSYDEDPEGDILRAQSEKIATPTDFEEHIDEIEILADKPELVIESGQTSSKPATRTAASSGSASASASAKVKNDMHSRATKSPYYMPRRPQAQSASGPGSGPGLRSYNGWEPGKTSRLPTEEEFREYIQTNMDYATASSFSSFVAAMQRHFPGFNVDNSIFSKIFDLRKIRSFNIGVNRNASTPMGNPPNRNNMNRNNGNNFGKGQMPNAGGKGPMPNMSGKGPMPNMAGKGPMPNMATRGNIPNMGGKGPVPNMAGNGPVPNISGKGSMPTTSGKGPAGATGGRVPMSNMGSKGPTPNTAGKKKHKHEDVGEMLVNYYFNGLLRARKTAAKEKNGQSNDGESSDDDYPENLEYYESIIRAWTPFLNLFEDPDFQRRLLKNKEFMSNLITKEQKRYNANMPKNTTSTCSTSTTSETTATTNRTVPETSDKTGGVKESSTTSATTTKATTTANTTDTDKVKTSENTRPPSPANATDTKESSLNPISLVVPKKLLETARTPTVATAKVATTTAATRPLAAQTVVTANIKSEKEVQTPVARTVKLRTAAKIPQAVSASASKVATSSTATTKTTTISIAAATKPIVATFAKPKSSCTIKVAEEVKSSLATTETTSTPSIGSVKKAVTVSSIVVSESKTSTYTHTITRAFKRPNTVETPASTKTTADFTSSATPTDAEDIIGTIPIKRMKR